MRRLICLFAMFLMTAAAHAQPVPVTPLDHLPALKGDYFKLESKEVGRPFHIYVAYPEGYDPAAAMKYPVVYLLDGDSLFPMLAPHHLFLHYDDKLPKALIVGIAYGGFDSAVNKRGFDYSMPAPDAKEDQGGAEKFHAFLKKELLPKVEGQYAADPQRRVLVGQSRGGHFVLYSAMTDPDLFWGRIASSPGLTPGEDFFANGTPTKAIRKDLKLMVFSGSGDRADSRARALAWNKAWEVRRDAPWQRWFLDMPRATHAANITDAYRSGMRWFFDYKEPQAETLRY
jgi:uncharacterized protein